MGFFTLKTVCNRWQPSAVFLIVLLTSLTSLPQVSSAQTNTLSPSAVNVLNHNLQQFELQRQDTSNLELLNRVNFQDLQLQPQQKTVLNLSRNISRVDTGIMNQINPAILAGIDKQNIFSFPELHVENTGSSDSDAGQIVYQPVITSLKPLVFDRISNAFTSTLSFLLLSQDQSSGDISSPMPIELHSDFLDNYQPSNQLQIGHLNLPSTNVDISARNVRDSVQIRIVTEANSDGYVTYLKVEPSLDLFTERKRLQGLGIQQIPIQLTWRGSSSDEPKIVNISSSKGAVTPNSVELSYNQPSVVYLRSEGIGNASLTASTTGSQSNTLQIRYIFPWVFLLFSIAGGFLGGTAKYFTLSEKPKSFLTTTIGSLTIGLLGALAYFVLGINLLNIEFSSTFNEFAVFGISALIAFFGIRKLGPSP
jgi:hypothetical protein